MQVMDQASDAPGTLQVTLNALACGVIVLPEDGCGVVDAAATAETVASLRVAIEQHAGGFQRVELLSPASGSTFDDNLYQSVVKACQAECGWVFVVTSRCVVHREVFARSTPLLNKVDGLWGTLVDLDGQGKLSLRTPQLPSASSLEELVLFPIACGVEAGFFVRTEKLLEVASQCDVHDVTSLCWELWSRFKCQKVPLQLVNLKPVRRASDPALAGRLQQRQGVLKAQAGFVEGTLSLMERQNLLTAQMQDLARQSSANINYFAASRQAAWCGYFEVKGFDGNPFMLFSQNDDLCTLSLQWTGEYEAASTYVWQKLARQAQVVLDIGAYTGLYSILAVRANPACRVVGFEPLSRNYARFVQNVQLNRLGNISAVRAAVGRQHGQVGLSIYSNGEFLTSGSSIVSNAGRQPVDVETVPLVAIDLLLEQNRLAFPELIKIDAEGAEFEVLSGMTKTLSRQPDLMLECLSGADCVAIENLLRPFGYRFYAIDELRKSVEPTASLTASSGSLHDLNRLVTVKTPEQLAAVLSSSSGLARVA